MAELNDDDLVDYEEVPSMHMHKPRNEHTHSGITWNEHTHVTHVTHVPHVTHAVCHHVPHRTRLPRRASRRTKSKSEDLLSTPYMRVAVLTRSPASRNPSLYRGMTPPRRILHLGEELTRAFMPLAFGVPMLDRLLHAISIVHE